MVELIDDRDAFEQLRPEWTDLLESSPADCLFLTWEWLFTWWTHQAGARRLFVVTVRSAGKLIAVAPFAQSARRVASVLPFPSLEFLGTGTVGSDYLDIIVRRGCEKEALDALGAYLVDRGMALDLAQIDARASASSQLAAALTSRGWSMVRRPTGVSPFIRLAGHTWESYLGTLGSEHRYNFQRRLRHANKSFAFRFEPARTPQQCREALDQLIALHTLRWQGHGGSDAFDSAEIVQFHHAMTGLAFDCRWLRLFVMSFDGVPVAALYGFLYHQVFYFYQSGYDPRYRKHSVGLLTMGLAIKNAIEEGALQYDMLHGDESYKFHWAKEVRELQHLELYAPDARATVTRRVREVSRALRTTARQVLPKTMGDRISAARRLGLWKGLYGAWVS
jgi:CelD/BcsL family acetyltransferase involved in cellulose biosynthesis